MGLIVGAAEEEPPDGELSSPSPQSRIPRIGARTVALASDGSDLAPAVQTVREIGNGPAFDGAIEDAFPGSSIEIDVANGLFRLSMRQIGLHRPLDASELSDGTLRYIALATALHTPRPPELMVLNVLEGSLHPSLLEPLAHMIATASERSQVIVVSHAKALVDALANHGAQILALEKNTVSNVIRFPAERASFFEPQPQAFVREAVQQGTEQVEIWVQDFLEIKELLLTETLRLENECASPAPGGRRPCERGALAPAGHVHALAAALLGITTLLTQLRLDASLFAPPDQRHEHTLGRAAHKGPPLPKLKTLLKDPKSEWHLRLEENRTDDPVHGLLLRA